MSPKEKAKELVDKYDETLIYLPRFVAKQCALIAADEILNITLSYAGKDYDFCQQVKIEIENL